MICAFIAFLELRLYQHINKLDNSDIDDNCSHLSLLMLSAFRSNGASSMRVHKKYDRHRQGIVTVLTQDIGDNPLLRAFRTDVASTHSAIIRYTQLIFLESLLYTL
jgi:hypothetical protein